jgi:hypothetical protein
MQPSSANLEGRGGATDGKEARGARTHENVVPVQRWIPFIVVAQRKFLGRIIANYFHRESEFKLKETRPKPNNSR